MPLPDLALSVRQPWTFAILFLGKPVENRSQAAIRNGRMGTGRIALHAGKGMIRRDFEEARDFMRSIGVECPPPAELPRGGIVGTVEVVDIVDDHDSPWLAGPRALVLRNPEPCEFIPAQGKLGYFPWKPAQYGVPPPPARWMLPGITTPVIAAPDEQMQLFEATNT